MEARGEIVGAPRPTAAAVSWTVRALSCSALAGPQRSALTRIQLARPLGIYSQQCTPAAGRSTAQVVGRTVDPWLTQLGANSGSQTLAVSRARARQRAHPLQNLAPLASRFFRIHGPKGATFKSELKKIGHYALGHWAPAQAVATQDKRSCVGLSGPISCARSTPDFVWLEYAIRLGPGLSPGGRRGTLCSPSVTKTFVLLVRHSLYFVCPESAITCLGS